MTKKEFEEKINDYRSLSALIKEATDQLDAVKADIISYMKDQDTDEVFTSDAKVTYKPASRKTFNAKLLAAALGEDHLDEFKTTSRYKTLKIY